MASCTNDIDGINQDLGTYLRVRKIRDEAFAKDMAAMIEADSSLTHMDECDWDEQFEAWLSLDQRL